MGRLHPGLRFAPHGPPANGFAYAALCPGENPLDPQNIVRKVVFYFRMCLQVGLPIYRIE